MKFKRITAFLTALILTVSLGASTAAASVFSDLTDHPDRSLIERYASLGILEGDGKGHFMPDAQIRRGDFCIILDRLFTYTETVPNTFKDLKPKAWYTKAVLKLNAVNVIQGDKGYVRPLDNIRWDEALVMLGRAFGIEEDFETPLPVEVGRWARGYLAAMWQAGYFSMEDFDPAVPITRAETVVVIENILADLGWSVTGKLLAAGILVPILEDVPKNEYAADAFYEENGRFYYDDGETPVAYGIDVSSYQGQIDWEAVAGDGIEFAIIRMGYRGYGAAGVIHLDEYFEDNLEGAKAAGLDVGVYFFSQATSPEEAEEEALVVLEQLDGRELTYPVIFDWETISSVDARANKVDNETLLACAERFNSIISEAGYQPMAYFSRNMGLLKYDLSVMKDYPFWLAYYISDPTEYDFYYSARMWQYSYTGRVAGIEGAVDLDICFFPFGRD